ncbi:MAG: hypothetical protein ACRDOI_38750 [Trebonia sp.]
MRATSSAMRCCSAWRRTPSTSSAGHPGIPTETLWRHLEDKAVELRGRGLARSVKVHLYAFGGCSDR